MQERQNCGNALAPSAEGAVCLRTEGEKKGLLRKNNKTIAEFSVFSPSVFLLCKNPPPSSEGGRVGSFRHTER